LVWNVLRKCAATVYNIVYLHPETVTALPCEICKPYSSSLQHAHSSRCSHCEWWKHYLASVNMVLWNPTQKLMVLLLRWTVDEVFTASHAQHHYLVGWLVINGTFCTNRLYLSSDISSKM